MLSQLSYAPKFVALTSDLLIISQATRFVNTFFEIFSSFFQLFSKAVLGGNNRARTYDPLLVRQMLSQLSYASE